MQYQYDSREMIYNSYWDVSKRAAYMDPDKGKGSISQKKTE